MMDTNEGRAKDELRACPFCGCADIFVEPDERGSGGQHVAPYHVGCTHCKAEQCHDDEDEAKYLWNCRADLSTPSRAPEVRGAGVSDHTLGVLHNVRLSLGMANPGEEWTAAYFEALLLGTLRAMQRHLAAPQPAADVMEALRACVAVMENLPTLDGFYGLAVLESARRALAAGAVPTVHPLDALLPEICQLIDAVKIEWQQQGCWSEWDQSVRDRIAAYNIAKMKGASAGADAPGAVPEESPDKGPWHVDVWPDGGIVLQSEDFTHDVALLVTGDFPGNKRDYSERLVAWMNAAAAVDCRLSSITARPGTPADASEGGVMEADRKDFEAEPLEQIIDEYVADYELIGDEGAHAPSDAERFLIKDAIMGLLADPAWDAEWGKLIDQRAAEQAAHRAAQPAGVEARDALRYRWLREGHDRMAPLVHCAGGALDYLIDAARLASKGEAA